MLSLYFANGTKVSAPGVFVNAVTFTLRIDLENEEVTPIRLYAEADTGCKVADVEVELIPADAQDPNETTNMWALAPDSSGQVGTFEDWGTELELGDVGAGAAGRVYFWVKAKAADTESVENDDTVLLQAEGIAEAV